MYVCMFGGYASRHGHVEARFAPNTGIGIGIGIGMGRTLQKSMLFTPLLPNAGPTGGEGDAWPAPTMSLTICSFASAFRAMVCVDMGDVELAMGETLRTCVGGFGEGCSGPGFERGVPSWADGPN